ncbi:UNVERIFIED_ORG: phosphoglycerol transferase MdoB-like AlkP superfamily enzyme [Rhodococcus erythropolis]
MIAVAALVGTWWNNLAYLIDGGSFWGYLPAGYANYASSSFMNDLVLLTLATVVFMIVEARRLGIKHVWVYVVLTFVIAISVMFPVFLIARERRLSETCD